MDCEAYLRGVVYKFGGMTVVKISLHLEVMTVSEFPKVCRDLSWGAAAKLSGFPLWAILS